MTAADSEDGVPEVVKIKFGDSEPGESEDPRGKQNRTEQERKKREEPREASESGRSAPKR